MTQFFTSLNIQPSMNKIGHSFILAVKIKFKIKIKIEGLHIVCFGKWKDVSINQPVSQQSVSQ